MMKGNLISRGALRRLLITAVCALGATGCMDPAGPDGLSDFMIRSPGDYYFASMLTFRPSPTSTDSILFQWEPARGADSYTIIFKQAESADSADTWQADLSNPSFTIQVDNPQEIEIPYGIPDPVRDTIPLPNYPALQYVLKLSALDALVADQPKGVPLYYVWTIEAHSGSRTGRSIEKHRFQLIRS